MFLSSILATAFFCLFRKKRLNCAVIVNVFSTTSFITIVYSYGLDQKIPWLIIFLLRFIGGAKVTCPVYQSTFLGYKNMRLCPSLHVQSAPLIINNGKRWDLHSCFDKGWDRVVLGRLVLLNFDMTFSTRTVAKEIWRIKVVGHNQKEKIMGCGTRS